MHIATWNVNSIKARLPNVLAWLEDAKPDVLLLQELKCETESFPALEFQSIGFKTHALGQKTYNGVAILSRHNIDDVREGLPGDDADTQARYVEATINGFRIASIYLPNGNPCPGEKFDYKLGWMKRLKTHAAKLLQDEHPVILGGDFNIIPENIDVHDPKDWEADALFHPQSRAAWREIVQLGYTDAFRVLHPHKTHAYSYWDYQAGAWQRDAGIRIDHFLLSPEATDRMTNCFIDPTPRGKDKASDHTPVLVAVRV
jgi:exodeoxyribonuclease-3